MNTVIGHVKETCSCGAEVEFEIETERMRDLLVEWRISHQHNLTVFAPEEGPKK